MANKTFNTRVKNKRDTAANWEAVATTFQPLDGELIIVDTSAGKTRFKVGRYDTAKGRLLYYNEIPFADEYLYNDLNESQGKIYDKLKGIDDKSIIESTLEPSTGTAAVKNYNIGIWQFPKTGFYKIKLSQLGTNITFLRLYARKTKDDGTLPEDDFSNDNLVMTSGAGGDGQLEYIYILADYLDIDSLTAYKIQFLNPILKQGITWVNTYDKTTQKWSFASAANVNAKNVSSNLTLTKGDTKTVYDGSVAREISIPTKTSELTNDSNFTTQTDLDNLTNTVVSYNAQENITDEQKAQARNNIGAISSSEVSSNYLSLDDTQELTEIQQDALKNKLYYINNLKVLSNWVEATEQCKKESGHVLVIQNDAHNDGDTVPDVEDSYPILLIPARIRGTNQNFYAIDAYGNNYMCSFSYSSFKFMVTKNAMYQQTMQADPTEDMQIATKKYVDNSSVQSDWNQNDTTAKDYIKNRICYEGETVTELGNTAEVWHNLTNGLSSTPISYRMNGKIYKDLTAVNGGGNDRIVYNGSVPEAYLVVVNYDSPVSQIKLNYPSNVTDFQFVKIENTVKQIDSKFIHTLDAMAEQVDDTTPINSKAVMSIMNELVNQFLPNHFISVVDQGFNENQKQIARNNIGIKDPFKVTFTRSYGKVSADKTAKEIKDAANNGQFVYGIFDGDPANIYTLSISNQNNIRFNRLYTETYSNMGLCYNVFYIDNPSDDFKGHYEETYCYNITAPSIKVVKVMLDNGTYKFDSAGVATSYNEIFNICKTSDGNNYTNSDVFISYGGNKLYKLDRDPWSASNPLVFKRVSYDSTTSSILFETFTVNTDSTITYESNVFEQNSTQSDWNQNDTSASDYIKNKPTIDTALSSTSENAIQNKAVKTAIDSLQTAIDGKVDTTALNYGLTQVTNDVAANYVKFTAEQTLTDEQKAQARDNINAPSPADAVYTATAASTDGVAYTATVSGIDSLTVGASFIMIPNKASTSKAPTLNVNGLGAKPIRRRLSSLTTSLQQGYSTNWIALNKPFTVVYDGTAWVIEGLTKTDGADVYGAVAQATADAKGNNIADTYATIAMLQSLLPKVTTITLTSNWVGDASPYYQDIALSCVTETSIVDLQPTPEQLNSWQDDGIAFTTLSGNGTVRVYVAGGKPSSAISVQVRVQEVTVI